MAVVAEEDIYHMAALVELLVGRKLLPEAVARLSLPQLGLIIPNEKWDHHLRPGTETQTGRKSSGLDHLSSGGGWEVFNECRLSVLQSESKGSIVAPGFLSRPWKSVDN
jgi:hypothetical protein